MKAQTIDPAIAPWVRTDPKIDESMPEEGTVVNYHSYRSDPVATGYYIYSDKAPFVDEWRDCDGYSIERPLYWCSIPSTKNLTYPNA